MPPKRVTASIPNAPTTISTNGVQERDLAKPIRDRRSDHPAVGSGDDAILANLGGRAILKMADAHSDIMRLRRASQTMRYNVANEHANAGRPSPMATR